MSEKPGCSYQTETHFCGKQAGHLEGHLLYQKLSPRPAIDAGPPLTEPIPPMPAPIDPSIVASPLTSIPPAPANAADVSPMFSATILASLEFAAHLVEYHGGHTSAKRIRETAKDPSVLPFILTRARKLLEAR